MQICPVYEIDERQSLKKISSFIFTDCHLLCELSCHLSDSSTAEGQGSRWLIKNRSALINSGATLLPHVADELVARGVFDPSQRDDYQRTDDNVLIIHNQICALLDSLHEKGEDAMLQFREVLNSDFPRVFARCFDPG